MCASPLSLGKYFSEKMDVFKLVFANKLQKHTKKLIMHNNKYNDFKNFLGSLVKLNRLTSPYCIFFNLSNFMVNIHNASLSLNYFPWYFVCFVFYVLLLLYLTALLQNILANTLVCVVFISGGNK